MKWRTDHSIDSFSEDVIIAYLDELSNTMTPSSLWSNFSMLKTILLANHNVDIKKYAKLLEYLKLKNKGYQPKKSNTLCKSHINKFLAEAPNEKYLMTKVKKTANTLMVFLSVTSFK